LAAALKVAIPPADMSKVKDVTADPPSSPLNTISLSCTPAVITASLELFVNDSIVVPPSLILTSAPSASKLMSAAASIVKLLANSHVRAITFNFF
jgi:hypothetical protein